jgi:lactoylglutathione lyase
MISKMEHTAIIVKDMDQSISFYSDLFGFKLRIRGESAVREMAFLYLEQQKDMEIELIRDKEPKEYSSNSVVNHLAFTVENIDEAISYYKNKGITFTSDEPKPTIDGGRMILFYGPNEEFLQFVEKGK